MAVGTVGTAHGTTTDGTPLGITVGIVPGTTAGGIPRGIMAVGTIRGITADIGAGAIPTVFATDITAA
jgi:hypothetical protein